MGERAVRLARFLQLGTPGATGALPAPVAPVRAAAKVNLAQPTAPGPPPWGVGPPLVPVDFDLSLFGWVDRDAAMSLPTVQRGRDLIVSAVSACPLTLWRTDRSIVPPTDVRVGDPAWFERPDPDRTLQWLLGWTADDLLFYGVGHWRILDRLADTFPSAFRRILPGGLDLRDDHAMVTDPSYNGGRPERVELRDLVEFLSPLEGILTNGGRPISIALSLDAAAARFADTEMPSGWISQREGSEDLTPEELAAEAARFAASRRMNAIAALNQWTEFNQASYDPSTMQIVEGRTYQALELSRLTNIPGYMTGAPAGTGMTYLNAEQAKADLIDFGASPLIGCIEQTLSGPNVTPRGQRVRLDLNAWLRNPFNAPGVEPASQDDVPAPPVTEIPT